MNTEEPQVFRRIETDPQFFFFSPQLVQIDFNIQVTKEKKKIAAIYIKFTNYLTNKVQTLYEKLKDPGVEPKCKMHGGIWRSFSKLLCSKGPKGFRCCSWEGLGT